MLLGEVDGTEAAEIFSKWPRFQIPFQTFNEEGNAFSTGSLHVEVTRAVILDCWLDK